MLDIARRQMASDHSSLLFGCFLCPALLSEEVFNRVTIQESWSEQNLHVLASSRRLTRKSSKVAGYVTDSLI